MQPISEAVLHDRYARPGETQVRQIFERVARALASAEGPADTAIWEKRFLDAMIAGFIPGGRILANAGVAAGGTLINCFVLPLDKENFTACANAALTTLRAGGGVGYDFSGLPSHRSHGEGQSPEAALRALDGKCRSLRSPRSGAQMAVLRWDHQDIPRFLKAKRHEALSTFNVSVGVTDEFMHQVEDGANASVARLWGDIVASALATGNPGLVFLDQINRVNNLSYCERINATNPCGEQPLPSFGACCLGSINLCSFVGHAFDSRAALDFQRLASVVRVAVRMLDNVLSTTPWPLLQQGREAFAKRRMGLGITGLGDTLLMLGLPYASDAARQCATAIMNCLRDEAYATSSELAKEKGPFPLFRSDPYLASSHFAGQLPEHLKACIRRSGVRNSHLLSIAPTGSISIAFCDNCSSGIEPPFGWLYSRQIKRPGGITQTYAVKDHAWALRESSSHGSPDPRIFRTSLDIPPQAHLQMLATLTQCVDGGISKTVPLPRDASAATVGRLFLDAWRLRVKGVTAFAPSSSTQMPIGQEPSCGPSAGACS